MILDLDFQYSICRAGIVPLKTTLIGANSWDRWDIGLLR